MRAGVARLRIFGFLLAPVALAVAADRTVPGEVSSPHPTLTNISLEWLIEGDDNLNGVVNVQFRAEGERNWRTGMPLRRVPAGTGRTTQVPFSWPNKHSGSIFDVSPDTAYEVRLTLADPDGGSDTRTLKVRTRPVPRPAKGSRERGVNPQTIAAGCDSGGDPPARTRRLWALRGTVRWIARASDRISLPGWTGGVRLDCSRRPQARDRRRSDGPHTTKRSQSARSGDHTGRGSRLRCRRAVRSTLSMVYGQRRRPGAPTATSPTTPLRGQRPGRRRLWAPTARTSAKASR